MPLISADRIFDGQRFMPEGTVLALNSDLSFAEYNRLEPGLQNNVKYYKGILTPGFVNAHCHLELSHLKGQIAQRKGLPAFAMEILKQRGKFSEQVILESMVRAEEQMWKSGIVAVGDISNGTESILTKTKSKIHYHTFVELIGFAPTRSEQVFSAGQQTLAEFHNAGLSASLAPHAPYSTSRELIGRIAEYSNEHRLPMSIHNQESEEEQRFFLGHESGFRGLYAFLNADISWFKAPGTSSLRHYADLLPRELALLVHNTVMGPDDITLAGKKETSWCFCPSANLYIEGKLPQFNLFREHRASLCLGTDSLASNDALDLVVEANHFLNATALFSQSDVLSMMTSNGARALGISDSYGSFIPGKQCGINLVDFAGNKLLFKQKIA
jgi:cytosine/adenosine deaminase-related metal-dependent hydrolase